MYQRGTPQRIHLSSLRPLARRAFNCAHELGHHLLGHGSSIDELRENQLVRPWDVPDEYSADTFAAYALMPTLGLRNAFAKRGLKWIESPIRYRADDAIVGDLAALADSVIDARSMAYHYASLGRNAADRWLEGDGAVPVKKYFYALRPALAIRWLRREGGRRPPMDLPLLVDAVGLPDGVTDDIAALVAAKRRSNERSNTARIPMLDTLIRDELARADEVRGGAVDPRAREQVETLFLHLVNT